MFAIVIGLGVSWVRADAAPRVLVLGSGSRLSLLVTSGQARMLIASGDDASQFANALADALNPTNRRIDVLVLAGGGKDLAVATRAVRGQTNSSTFVIDGPLVSNLTDLHLSSDRVIATATRFRLDGGVEVTIHPSAARDGNWSGEIRQGDTTILVASNSAELPVGPAAQAVVVTAGYDAANADAIAASAIVVPAAAASWDELHDDLATADPRWAIRVAAGTAVEFAFIESGLRLPPNVRSIGPADPTQEPATATMGIDG